MLLFRKIIFWAFFVTYLILCPLLILYMLGYIFNPVKSRFSQTGLVHISSIPAGADVFLGKSRFTIKTPATIQELLPGEYTIRLFLRGYRPWRHSVSVEAGKANTFEDILLLPNYWQSQRINSRDFKSLVPLSGTNYILAATGTNLGDYFIFDWKKEIVRSLILEDSQFFSFPVTSIFTQENSSLFIVYGGPLWKREYLLLDCRESAPPIKNITRSFSARPLALSWEPNVEERVFALSPERLDFVDLKMPARYPVFVEKIKGFGLFEKRLYYIGPDDRIMKATLDGKREEEFEAWPQVSETLFRKSGFYKIKFLKGNVILFLSNKGHLLANAAPYELEKEGVIDVTYRKEEEALAYWTKQTISVVNLLQEKVALPAIGNYISVRTAYEGGRQIAQCFWAHDNRHIIFRDGDKVFLLEIEPQGENRIERLFTVKSGTSVFYSDATESLYYLNRDNGSLSKIKIINREKTGGGQ